MRCPDANVPSDCEYTPSTLAPGASKFLEDLKARAGERSLLGRMAAEFLAL